MISVNQSNLSLDRQGRNSQVCIVGLVWFRAIFERFSSFQPEDQVFIILMQVDNLINKIY